MNAPAFLPRSGYVNRPRSSRAKRLRALIGAWLENQAARRQLRRCALLDPRFVGDIGFTPADFEMECIAPFWIEVPRREDFGVTKRAA